jgi:regulation of enolase protein 1 (concanavalin A-like superfamily)
MSFSFRHFVFSLLALLCISVSPAWSEEFPLKGTKPDPSIRPLRILIIGNSHTARNGLAYVFKNLVAKTDWQTPIVDPAVAGGTSLLEHTKRVATTDKIKIGNWDVVILQEDNTALEDEHLKGVNGLIPLIKAASPGAWVGFYQVAGFLNDPVEFPNWEYLFYDHTETNHRTIVSDMNRLKNSFAVDSFAVYCGSAWANNYSQYGFKPPFRLHDTDGVHPTPIATYLNALIFYRAIYGGSTAGMGNGGLDLTQEEMSRMQALADAMPARIPKGESAAPVITFQPYDREVYATTIVPTYVTFYTAATGIPAPTFQWKKNGVDIVGATDAIYTTPRVVNSDHGSTYRCVVTNSAGSVTSKAATLAVKVVIPSPEIKSHPVDQTVTAGSIAIFSVTATGKAPLKFQWQKNEQNILGATNTSYTTPPTVAADSGSTYRCVVTNDADFVASKPATLTVRPATIAPGITSQPVDMTVTVGMTATFTVQATGTPAPTFQWQKGTTNIAGATTASYTTPVTVLGDDGSTYRCVVKNSADTKVSEAAKLTVIAWSLGDIGSVAAAGSSRLVNGIWTVKGSGADIWKKEDAFHFVRQSVSGDVRITARVDSLTNTNPWSKAGVMIRDSSAANARNAFTFVTPDRGVGFQRRVTTGEASAYTAGSNQHAPYWVRLERIGDKLIGSSSSDGKSWKEFRSVTISFGDTVDVGLAVTSHNDGELATAIFSQVELTTIPTASN